MTELADIIQDSGMEPIVRVIAIDALRRLRVQMPRKIQNVLLPIFLNSKEKPEVRMAAFGMIIKTIPGPQVIDQISMVIKKERSQAVLTFVYNAMKQLAKTRNPACERVAKHIQNTLKLVNVDDKTLKYSGVLQIPMFSEREQEGVFLNLISAFSGHDIVPMQLTAQLHSFINEELQLDDLSLIFTQKNIESTIQKVIKQISYYIQGNKANFENAHNTRAQRLSSNGRGEWSTPREIFSMLGIKSRHSSMYEDHSGKSFPRSGEDSSFAAFDMRIYDVDQFIVPMSSREGPAFLRTFMKGELSGMAFEFGKILNQWNIQKSMASNFVEKRATIATSAGLPLKTLQSVPVIALVSMQPPSTNWESTGQMKAQVRGQFAANWAQMQKIEIWCPITTTGVHSIRSLEINVPVNSEVSGGMAQGWQFKVRLPRSNKVQMLGLHTLASTFTAEYDEHTRLFKDKQIRVNQYN